MRNLSKTEIENVSGGFIGGFITKNIDIIGRVFTTQEVFNKLSDHYGSLNAKMVADFKKDPSTVTNHFSYNGDF